MKYASLVALPAMFSLMIGGCAGSADTSATMTKTTGKKSMAQVIELSGSKVAEVTDDGEIWILGTKEGSFTETGEIWVAGGKEGELTRDGEVWKAGDKIGDISSNGEVWRDGNEIGTVESDGTIWLGSSRGGSFEGGDPRHAAAIVFYGFFDLSE